MRPLGCCRQSWPCCVAMHAFLSVGVFASATMSVCAYKEGSRAHMRQFMNTAHPRSWLLWLLHSLAWVLCLVLFIWLPTSSWMIKIRWKILIRVVVTVIPVEAAVFSLQQCKNCNVWVVKSVCVKAVDVCSWIHIIYQISRGTFFQESKKKIYNIYFFGITKNDVDEWN